MADQRSPEQIRRSLEQHRMALAGEIDQLRGDIAAVSDWRKQLREHKREVMIAAGAAGFIVAGGIGALVRLVSGGR